MSTLLHDTETAIHGCESVFGAEMAQRVDEMMEQGTGQPCPGRTGGNCPLLPRPERMTAVRPVVLTDRRDRSAKLDERSPRPRDTAVRPVVLTDRRKLADLMASRGVSRRQLAQAAGWTSPAYLGRLLRGDLNTLDPKPAVRIATSLGVAVDELFFARGAV